jgi:signal transduction histidine kinase
MRGDVSTRATVPQRPSSSVSAEHGPLLGLHAALSAVVGFSATGVWAVTGGGHYWPGWIWIGLGVMLAGHAALSWSLTLRPPGPRAVGIVGAFSLILALANFAIWGLAGAGFFWPVFPCLVTATATAILALVVFRGDLLPSRRELELSDRVDELTRTRSGALNVQAAELRRIERDLHDGAQARLVALSMQLGRAEERLEDTHPEAAELVRNARREATAAIGELRDLARGIAPPVLADRGLPAALEALAKRSAIPVRVDAELDERLLPVVEAAAYFVAAEAITNVAKHAPQAHAYLTLSRSEGTLKLNIADDGPGGADPTGLGLTGLRHRVEALDGALRVKSAPTAGTLIEVELPCGW